ncbi:MAG: cytochrome c oxidase subunit 3 [Gammaproteobacteria bacterium]|nr:cytochrome c oxidase subunit 3 [Gammaproteobacteria bacterium]
MAATHDDAYYVPHGTKWPIMGSIGLTVLVSSFASLLNGSESAGIGMIIGVLIMIAMMFLWFAEVIKESHAGYYNAQVDVSFRMGMGWFIFSEVMFFAAFFGALYYARIYSVPWVGGEGAGFTTNEFLWPDYEAIWPTNGPSEVGGEFKPMAAWGLPALNTIILLTSGVTVTIAHHGILKNQRAVFNWGLFATVLLGALFVYCQYVEYAHAYSDYNLTLESGIYGSTFFMLTGFHGFHVTIGAIMLAVMWFRGINGHFNGKNHFAFEAAAWYWHFVDVVWLGLFIFVYWL